MQTNVQFTLIQAFSFDQPVVTGILNANAATVCECVLVCLCVSLCLCVCVLNANGATVDSGTWLPMLHALRRLCLCLH
jgi:hypothetical protein